MRVALSSGSLYTYGLNRVFALAAEAGYDGVEVLVDQRFDTRQAGYLQHLVGQHGIPILSFHAPFWLKRLDGWPQTFPQSVAATAELARTLGAGIVVAHLPLRDQRPYARWLREELAAWQQVHPHPVVAVENMPVGWIRGWPFGPVEVYRLNRLDEWGAFAHLTLDTTHLGTKGLDPLEIYGRVRDRVAHVHLSNAQQTRRRRVRQHRRLEDGFLALDAFLALLAQDRYGGIVTVELHPDALGATSEEQVRQHLRRQLAFCREHGGT